MSVNVLQRPSHPVTVADELESFFHVLTYFCVRFLRSNCKNPSSWIDNYFERYSGPDHGYTCGQKSITMEVTGKLRTLVPQRPLIFDSPVDTIFSTLLPCFKARYKILNDEAVNSVAPSTEAEVPKPKPPITLPALENPIMSSRDCALTESEMALREEIRKEFDEWTPYDDAPTVEERKLALKIADHEFLLELLERALRNASWPDDDRISSTQPLSSAPAETPMPAAEPARPEKRQKKTTPSLNTTMPARRRPSTRHTQSQPRNIPIRTKSKS